MSAAGVSTLDRRVLERVLEMGSGYVLDFTDRTFVEFFREFDVDIDDASYRAQGTSKAKRLRFFLTTTPPPLTGRVLSALLSHRLAWKPEIDEADLAAFREVVGQLGGERGQPGKGTAEATEAELLRLVFRADAFTKLPLDAPLVDVLVARMGEAQRCVEATANLAAVILCGSVLEGLCLGFGSRHPERVNRAYARHFGRDPGQFHEWRLKEWIEVLESLGDLSPNISKFGHALRDFRNFVHPHEQLAHRFSPDEHTARISFQVVVAAIDDLVRAEAAIRSG